MKAINSNNITETELTDSSIETLDISELFLSLYKW